MIPQINILSVVDVIGALASGSLKNNLFMMDNRRGALSSVPSVQNPQSDLFQPDHGRCLSPLGPGSGALVTNATFTQVLNWHVLGIDFQTDVQINKITFYRNGIPITTKDTPCARLQRYGAPSGHYWAGVINLPSVIPGGIYHYLIEFDIGKKIMTMENFATLNVSA